MSELISIITPTYNSEKFIGETIDSIQNQSYGNWELILIDDGSTDQTVEIIKKFQEDDSRIRLICLEKNSGPAVARNKGIENSNGRYIAFLDSDDLWKKKKLECQLQWIKKNNLVFTFSFYELIAENGNSLNTEIRSPNPLHYTALMKSNFVGNLTGIYDRNYFPELRFPLLQKRHDWVFWLNILVEIKTAYPYPESLAFYRKRKDSLSSSKIHLLKYNYRVYKDYLNKGKVLSVFYMIRFLVYHFTTKKSFTFKRPS